MVDLSTFIESVLISAALAAYARGEYVEVSRAVFQALPPEHRLALWPARRRSYAPLGFERAIREEIANKKIRKVLS